MRRESLNARLNRLEDLAEARATADAQRCPACGVSWPGCAYLAIEKDGSHTVRCIRCSAERPHPGGWMKTFYRELIEALR